MEAYPLRRAAANWWVYLLAGILLIIAGVWAFTYPGDTYLALSILFAAVIFTNGASSLIFAVSNRAIVRGWVWLALLGAAEAVLGIYLLTAPAIAAGSLAFYIGFWLMLRSTITISNAFMMKQLGTPNWGWVLVLGILGVFVSLDVLASPGIGALGASLWVASGMVVLGIASCVLGFRLRPLAKAVAAT